MARFCGKCGSKLDSESGLCPKCDVKRTPKMKRLFFVAGILLVTAAFILCVQLLSKRREIPPMSDTPTSAKVVDSSDCTEKESTNDRKLVRIVRYRDNGGMEQLYELSYGENGSISNVTVWSFGKDGEQVLEKIYPIEYDAAGRAIRNGIAEQGSYLEYKYDEAGNLVHSIGTEGSVVNTDYEYDGSGRLIQSFMQSDCVDTTITYQYDDMGNILTRTERDEYSFGTVDEKTYHYHYNQQNQLSSVVSDSSETHFTYDTQGRVCEITSKDDAGRSTTQYRYDCSPFVICTQTQEPEEADLSIRFSTADIRDTMDHRILSVHIGQGIPQVDAEGYLAQVRSEEEGFTMKFLYE